MQFLSNKQILFRQKIHANLLSLQKINDVLSIPSLRGDSRSNPDKKHDINFLDLLNKFKYYRIIK
jgi:hypothetical protein